MVLVPGSEQGTWYHRARPMWQALDAFVVQKKAASKGGPRLRRGKFTSNLSGLA